ncbi:hypothetical protein FOXG_13341 [Fusarium oxysporum f. sp. lycopersici 4287]|uniref:No apical meristem-associated C-terminal domain-containing protein n=2 Tax=Fusarium oxysporum TaxID=5507 RepID=A0A0J9VU19_FUSO4|nr:hypothetical protein FOXG_13341 [Fusarium oxysporum f. sp. lycopersici 4287]KNB14494.1 hypothetical protein FOXG_13341 [Fusarium oxysporum f. sp. lycopersici 4287]
MAQTLAHWHRILLSLIILYPIDLPLPTFATHFQSRYTNRLTKAKTSTQTSKSTIPNRANPAKKTTMSSAMSEKSTSRSKRNSPKRSLASGSGTSDAKRRKSEHVKKFTEMKLEDIEQIFQNSRNALNKAEELYQDAEKRAAMIRKANATKDVARLEMIKDAREAIEKRDNLQIQVEKQKKELFAIETKLLMWDNVANMAVENLKEDDLEHLFQFQG